MKVILMGYMGSGKSTIGKDLAEALNFDFIDLDKYIVENEEMNIPEIFKKKGEIHFRKKEHGCLSQILNDSDRIVLSLGGGTPCYGSNVDLILDSDDSTLIYLKGSVLFLAERLFRKKGQRPLLAHLQSEEELHEYIGKHLFERNFYYNQAHITIDIDNKSKRDIVEELIFKLF